MLRPFRDFMSPFRQHPRLAVPVMVVTLLAAGTLTVLVWTRYHFHAAQRALERYALDDAQQHLDWYLKVHPGSAPAHLLAAQTARRRGAYTEAEEHLTACAKRGGSPEATTLERLLLNVQQGNFAGSEESLQARTSPDDPESIRVLEALANGYMNCYWYSRALVCLNILLEREPRHPQAVLMRARVWESRALKGEKEADGAALLDYEKAVELNPTFEARLGLAATLYRLGRPWDAKLQFDKLRRLQPSRPEVNLGLARCLFNLGAADEAERLLDELLSQNPDYAPALLERGRLAMHTGRWPDAERDLREAASRAARYDVEALRLLGRCLEYAAQPEELRKCQDQLAERETEILTVERLSAQAKREPQNVTLEYEIGLRLLRLGREQEGVATLLFVLKQAPDHRPAHAALADYFDHAGQQTRAARHRRAGMLAGGVKSPSR